jgi:hypothetical protein
MKNRKRILSMLLPLGLLSVIFAGLVFTSCNEADGQAPSGETKKAIKVLYVTMENCPYHKYPEQKVAFMEFSKENGWDTTVYTEKYDELIAKLAKDPNFGDGYDVIVYNFCMALSNNLEAPYNIIEQTKTKGIPALLVHGSLHSFWPTFKAQGPNAVQAPGAPEKAKTTKELLDKWNKEHPGKDFPSWATFTGIASVQHGPKTPIKTKNLLPEHATLKDVPEHETMNTELYNNYIKPEDSKVSIPIMQGTQGKETSVILWEHPLGKSKTVSFTLGHFTEEWTKPEFRQVLKNTVNYLAENPSSAK